MITQQKLTITRIFNAPLELVWNLWTDPVHLARWWGPMGFSNPLCKWEVKVGGTIYIRMQAPDGTIHPMDGQFHEVMEFEKLVFTSAALDANGKRLFEILNTVTFREQDKKTIVSMTAIVSNARPEAEPYLSGTEEGWNQSMERLEDYLNKI